MEWVWKKFKCNTVLILIKTINNRNLIVLVFKLIYMILICKILSVEIITRSNSFPVDWSNQL